MTYTDEGVWFEHPFLEVVEVVEGAVEGQRVCGARDAGEAAVLEQPPVPIAPAGHLRHDHLCKCPRLGLVSVLGHDRLYGHVQG